MHEERLRGAHALMPITLILFTVTLAGCAGDPKCFPDGHCIEMPGNFGYYLRWGIAIALGGVAALGVLISIYGAFTEGMSAGCVLGIGTAIIAAVALAVQPGPTSPRERAENAVKEYELQLAKHRSDAEAKKRAEESPPYQLERARAADAALKKRHEEMQKTQAKWTDEYESIRRELQTALKQTGARSHEELLKKPNVPQKTLNLLNRAAHLRVLVAELDALIESADRTLVELDQQIWKLDKMVELNAVTTPEQSAAIKRALASATELVRERTTAINRADIAAEEAKLFGELVGGKK